MLVVVAGRQDSAARCLVSRWAAYGASLLTAADLSVAGWRYHVGATRQGVAVVDGRAVPASRITGVLIRLPYVSEAEIPHIHPADRSYVAAEMTAFLAAWLSRLGCPVLNRPAPGCLAGPAWRQEQWVHLAARIGLPVRPVRRRAVLPASRREPDGEAATTVVTVAGQRCVGTGDPSLVVQARQLAGAAGVELLSVHFTGPERGAALAGVSLVADVTSPEVADAIFEHLRRGSRC